MKALKHEVSMMQKNHMNVKDALKFKSPRRLSEVGEGTVSLGLGSTAGLLGKISKKNKQQQTKQATCQRTLSYRLA